MSVTRRRFLAATATTGAALAAPAISSPAVLGARKDKKYRTALIGTGWWGMNIFRTGKLMASGSRPLVATWYNSG